MDYERLSKIANKSATSLSIFQALAGRERDPQKGKLIISRLTVLMKTLKLSFNKAEILSTFVELEKVNVGKLKGDVFQIADSIILKDLCKEVLQMQQSPTQLKPAAKGLKSQLIPLSNQIDRAMEITCPDDLTRQEADFAVRFFMRSRGFA